MREECAREIRPIMPWRYFGQMENDDLKAIFAYLRTVNPVRHRVDNSEPVAFSRICKQKHHGGALNCLPRRVCRTRLPINC